MDDMDHSEQQSANLLSPRALSKHIMEFQAFAGIEQTGELDDHTIGKHGLKTEINYIKNM